MTAMMTEKLEALMSEEEFVNKLAACATEEKARAMLAVEGIELSDEEWKEIMTNGTAMIEKIQSEGELNDADLGAVVGGKNTACVKVQTAKYVGLVCLAAGLALSGAGFAAGVCLFGAALSRMKAASC